MRLQTLDNGHCATLFIALLFLVSCQKEKLAFTPYHLVPDTLDMTPSNVRLIDLFGFTQLRGNGDSLTNFSAVSQGTNGNFAYPATPYFPEDGLFGSFWYNHNNYVTDQVNAVWDIPKHLFRADGSLNLEMINLDPYGQITQYLAHSVEDGNETVDHYVVREVAETGQLLPAIVPVSRSGASPRPGHIKIRLINLTTLRLPEQNLFANHVLEPLEGPLTLTYADGTPVGTPTSTVSEGQVSDYIEIPYGTYQFKVLTAGGREVPAANSHNGRRRVDPATSSMPLDLYSVTNLVYTRVQTYQPGGVYTLVVAPSAFEYIVDQFGRTQKLWQNAVQYVADIPEPMNTEFSRFQAFNAMPASDLQFLVDGEALGDVTGFGASTPYATHQVGDRRIEVRDAAGQTVATTGLTAEANQNYTLWAHPDRDGNLRVQVVVNDLSQLRHLGEEADNGMYDYAHTTYPFDVRFVNLCPDVPLLSFTRDDGQPVAPNIHSADTAVYRLRPGVFSQRSPYIRVSREVNYLMAYRSSMASVPGVFAGDIPVLPGQASITNPDLYTQGGKDLPVWEPGVYTVALIGRVGEHVPAADRARMVILKHTK